MFNNGEQLDENSAESLIDELNNSVGFDTMNDEEFVNHVMEIGGIKNGISLSKRDIRRAREGLKSTLGQIANYGHGRFGYGGRSYKTIGLAITNEFVNEGAVEFVGRKLSDNIEEAAYELATEVMILRNPNFETMRYFYVKEGEIVDYELE